LKKTYLGMTLLLLVLSVFALTLETRPVKASGAEIFVWSTSSVPVACELPKWLLAIIFVVAVLAGGNLVAIVVFLLWCRKKKAE
jgi:ABC-type microcin C transport system permease subunit YejB